jgi:hypothetical protein
MEGREDVSKEHRTQRRDKTIGVARATESFAL